MSTTMSVPSPSIRSSSSPSSSFCSSPLSLSSSLSLASSSSLDSSATSLNVVYMYEDGHDTEEDESDAVVRGETCEGMGAAAKLKTTGTSNEGREGEILSKPKGDLTSLNLYSEAADTDVCTPKEKKEDSCASHSDEEKEEHCEHHEDRATASPLSMSSTAKGVAQSQAFLSNGEVETFDLSCSASSSSSSSHSSSRDKKTKKQTPGDDFDRGGDSTTSVSSLTPSSSNSSSCDASPVAENQRLPSSSSLPMTTLTTNRRRNFLLRAEEEDQKDHHPLANQREETFDRFSGISSSPSSSSSCSVAMSGSSSLSPAMSFRSSSPLLTQREASIPDINTNPLLYPSSRSYRRNDIEKTREKSSACPSWSSIAKSPRLPSSSSHAPSSSLVPCRLAFHSDNRQLSPHSDLLSTVRSFWLREEETSPPKEELIKPVFLFDSLHATKQSRGRHSHQEEDKGTEKEKKKKITETDKATSHMSHSKARERRLRRQQHHHSQRRPGARSDQEEEDESTRGSTDRGGVTTGDGPKGCRRKERTDGTTTSKKKKNHSSPVRHSHHDGDSRGLLYSHSSSSSSLPECGLTNFIIDAVFPDDSRTADKKGKKLNDDGEEDGKNGSLQKQRTTIRGRRENLNRTQSSTSAVGEQQNWRQGQRSHDYSSSSALQAISPRRSQSQSQPMINDLSSTSPSSEDPGVRWECRIVTPFVAGSVDCLSAEGCGVVLCEKSYNFFDFLNCCLVQYPPYYSQYAHLNDMGYGDSTRESIYSAARHSQRDSSRLHPSPIQNSKRSSARSSRLPSPGGHQEVEETDVIDYEPVVEVIQATIKPKAGEDNRDKTAKPIRIFMGTWNTEYQQFGDDYLDALKRQCQTSEERYCKTAKEIYMRKMRKSSQGRQGSAVGGQSLQSSSTSVSTHTGGPGASTFFDESDFEDQDPFFEGEEGAGTGEGEEDEDDISPAVTGANKQHLFRKLKTGQQPLRDWIRAGYDVYVITLQEVTNDNIFETVSFFLEAEHKEPFLRVNMGQGKISGLGKGAWTKMKSTSMACWIRESMLAPHGPIQPIAYKGFSFTLLNGSKGAFTLILKIFDQIVCFIGCHVPASKKERAKARAAIRSRIAAIYSVDKDVDFARVFHHIIWAGDFNFRCQISAQEALNLLKAGKLQELVKHDEGVTESGDMELHRWVEAPITFLPTYKKKDGRPPLDKKNPNWVNEEYQVTMKKKGMLGMTKTVERPPSWCDRVFHWSLNELEYNLSATSEEYFAAQPTFPSVLLASDHAPVGCGFRLYPLDPKFILPRTFINDPSLSLEPADYQTQ